MTETNTSLQIGSDFFITNHCFSSSAAVASNSTTMNNLLAFKNSKMLQHLILEKNPHTLFRWTLMVGTTTYPEQCISTMDVKADKLSVWVRLKFRARAVVDRQLYEYHAMPRLQSC